MKPRSHKHHRDQKTLVATLRKLQQNNPGKLRQDIETPKLQYIYYNTGNFSWTPYTSWDDIIMNNFWILHPDANMEPIDWMQKPSHQHKQKGKR